MKNIPVRLRHKDSKRGIQKDEAAEVKARMERLSRLRTQDLPVNQVAQSGPLMYFYLTCNFTIVFTTSFCSTNLCCPPGSEIPVTNRGQQ